MVLLFLCYGQIRYLTKDDTAQAMANARRVVGLEQRTQAFTEGAVQDLALRSRAVVTFLNHYYVGVHFPLTAIFVVWVLARHPGWYRRVRWWLISVSAIALAIHVAFPLAPPRMLGDHGFVDTLREFGPRIYSADTDGSVANQFAAMPSLHFGWAAIVAGAFVAIKGTRLSLLAFLHPLITLLAIVATANHYWLDAVVALVLVIGCGWAIMLAGRRPRRPMHACSRAPQPSRRSVRVEWCGRSSDGGGTELGVDLVRRVRVVRTGTRARSRTCPAAKRG